MKQTKLCVPSAIKSQMNLVAMVFWTDWAIRAGLKISAIDHGQALLLDSYAVKKFLRSVEHEAGNLGPKLQPRGGFFGP